MADLIDRKVLLREMEELYNKRAVDAYMTGDREIHVSWNDAVYLVTVAPTIEAEPIKHGRWLIYNILDYAKRPTGRKVGKCSVCGQLTPDFRLITEKPNWSYCPNCMARMFDNDIDVSDKNVGKIDEVEDV